MCKACFLRDVVGRARIFWDLQEYYVCVCVYVYVDVYVYVHLYLYAHIYNYMCLCSCIFPLPGLPLVRFVPNLILFRTVLGMLSADSARVQIRSKPLEEKSEDFPRRDHRLGIINYQIIINN